MNSMLWGAVTVLVTASLAQGQGRIAAARSYVLDFTSELPAAAARAHPARERESGASRDFPTTWEAGAESIPLQVSLVELDRSGYAIGDRVFYEVTLKHVGTKPFAFPWSRSTVPFDREHQVTQRAVILLAFQDDVLGSQMIGDENTTYGSTSVPGSLLLLKPGDTVRIRAQGHWYLPQGMPKTPPTGWVRDLAVHAYVHVHGLSETIPEAKSQNAIQVQLQQRR